MEEIGLEKARDTLGDIVNKAALAGQHSTITRNGKPTAVLVGYDWYMDSLTMLSAGAPNSPEARMLAEAKAADHCQADQPLVDHHGPMRTDPATGLRMCDNHFNTRPEATQ